MLNAICDIIAKIVFSGVDGKILVVPLIILIWVMVGQAKEFNYVYKEVMKEEAK